MGCRFLEPRRCRDQFDELAGPSRCRRSVVDGRFLWIGTPFHNLDGRLYKGRRLSGSKGLCNRARRQRRPLGRDRRWIVAFRARRPASPLHQRRFAKLDPSTGLSDVRVGVIHRISNDRLWFGAESLVKQFDGRSSQNLPVQLGGYVLAIQSETNGDVWIGTSRNTYRWNKKRLHEI